MTSRLRRQVVGFAYAAQIALVVWLDVHDLTRLQIQPTLPEDQATRIVRLVWLVLSWIVLLARDRSGPRVRMHHYAIAAFLAVLTVGPMIVLAQRLSSRTWHLSLDAGLTLCAILMAYFLITGRIQSWREPASP